MNTDKSNMLVEGVLKGFYNPKWIWGYWGHVFCLFLW